MSVLSNYKVYSYSIMKKKTKKNKKKTESKEKMKKRQNPGLSHHC